MVQSQHGLLVLQGSNKTSVYVVVQFVCRSQQEIRASRDGGVRLIFSSR